MSDDVQVWFDDLLVGQIAVADDGALSFSYADKWLATKGAFALSQTLPLKAGQYPTDIISPWLANLLPEEEQLRVLTRSLGLSQSDALAVLREIGGDTAGALSFDIPSKREDWAYTPLTEFYRTDDAETALEQHFEDLGRRPLLVGAEGVRVSLAGGQKKTALAVLDANGHPVLRLPGKGDILAVPLNGAPSTVILKPENALLPGIVENEIYCLRLARAAGISSAEVTLVQARKRRAICVLRYDRRIGRNGGMQRVHQEDFAQANGVPPGRKYERGSVPGLNLATLLNTGRHLPSIDALALLDQLIFNILVGNTDAHAKNYSLLLPVGAEPRLAPLYDVSTVLPWPGIVQTLAQNIAGKRRKPGHIDARHWDAIAKSVGYRPTDVRQRVQSLVDSLVANRVAAVSDITSLPGCAAGYVEEAAELIEENALRIAGRL
ncbi:MAG: type II toxin-antitoxin system HipA family toxin [Maricaulis sp.]|nr:type II toxin-antitoxin system HipA family toxin [Maricaulis sp.]